MKQWYLLLGILFITFFSCSKQNSRGNSNLINIEEAMESMGDFSISEIANNIAYVALETTDNSLIGDHPDIAIWGDKIIVSSMNQPLMVFDKKTGHFCNRIGHIGDDPEGFARDMVGSVPFWIDHTNGTVYLMALSERDLLRYNLDGTFLGRVTSVFRELEIDFINYYFFHISNDVITAHNKMWHANEPYIFRFNAVSGTLLNTVSSIVQPFPQDAIGFYYMGGTNIRSGGGTHRFEYSDNRTARIVPNSPSVWEYNGQQYLKESFIDTVYTIQGNSLEPRLTIDLGKWK